MGNGQAQEYNPTEYAHVIGKGRDDCQVYENCSGTQFEKYLVANNGSSDFENGYQWRIKNPQPEIVRVLFAGSRTIT